MDSKKTVAVIVDNDRLKSFVKKKKKKLSLDK